MSRPINIETSKLAQSVIACLETLGPSTLAAIAKALGANESTLRNGGYIKALKSAEKLFICGWRRANGNGFSTPVFRAGKGKECPRPKLSQVGRNTPMMIAIVEALKKHGALTYRELATIICSSHTTIKNAKYMEELVAQNRVHVVDWKRNKNGPMAAIYAAGAGFNAPRPPAYSQGQKSARYRIKKATNNPLRDVIPEAHSVSLG